MKKKENNKNSKKIKNENLNKSIFPFKKYLKHHPTWNTRASSYPTISQILVPIFSVLIVLWVRLQLEPYLKRGSPFLMFFAAIMISAWFGGFKPAFLATILSALAINYFLFNPNSLGITNISDALLIIFFILIGTLMSILSQLMHNTLKKLEIKNIELKRSEEEYRLVVSTVKDYAIYTLDPDGYITSWNEGSQNITGYSEKEADGKHFSIFYTPENIEKGEPWKALKTAISKGRFEDEGWRNKKDGSSFWANVIITPLKDKEDKLHGFSQITRDMTSHKELDLRKDEFISIASHELKTPITSIKVFNQTLQKLIERGQKINVLEYLKKMNVQIDKLTDLVTDLLDISKMQAGKLEFKMEYFDLNKTVGEIIENMQFTTQKHSIVVKGRTNKLVFGDKERLGQVLINFLTNAIKYSPNSGDIIVKITSDNKNITVGVQDFGIGIAKEHHDKIFNPFYRVYNEEGITFPGLGIGLHISSDIIKRHNGRIWVDSEKNKGSTFYFSVPCKK